MAFNFTPDPRFGADPDSQADPRFKPFQPTVTPTVAIPRHILLSNMRIAKSRANGVSMIGANYE